MVHACIGAMSAAFLPDSAIERLYAPGTENRFSGQGTPTGMLKKVDGGYLLNGKWSYASGIYHATHTHTAALVDDGTGQPAKDANGDVIVLCAHAEVGNHELLGNWDVLGLRATGSIDYGAKDVFIPDDMVFPILTAEPQRQKEFFSLGVVGLAAIGHCGWAIGAVAPHAGRDRRLRARQDRPRRAARRERQVLVRLRPRRGAGTCGARLPVRGLARRRSVASRPAIASRRG